MRKKNRADPNSGDSPAYLPAEEGRVKLTPELGVEGSDYINATILQGYHSASEFIVTQHPTVNTTGDFLRMVWEQNCATIVCLQPPEDPLPCCPWAEHNSEHLQLQLRHREEFSFAVRQELQLSTPRDDCSLATAAWTLRRWPQTLGESRELMQLVTAVEGETSCASNPAGGKNSPIIVVDGFGGSYAGIFCCLCTLHHQLLHEDCVDAYSLFKIYHSLRPGIFYSQADLQFIYEVIEYHARLLTAARTLTRSTALSGSLATSGHSRGQQQQRRRSPGRQWSLTRLRQALGSTASSATLSAPPGESSAATPLVGLASGSTGAGGCGVLP